jgi:hypothetical protein
MSKHLFLLAAFFSLQLSAMEIDSVLREKMIREGQLEMCNLLEHNAHAAPEDKRFLVVIDGDPNGVNYTREYQINTTEDILDQQTIDAINDTLAATYAKYGIEMYVIMMKSFNLLFQTPLPAYPTAIDIFTTRLYDETSNINTLRATHTDLTYQIAYGSMARTKDYLVYSRAEYKSNYAPGKIGAWNLIKTIPIYGTTTTYPKLDELRTNFQLRTNNDPDVMQAGLYHSLKAASVHFYETARYMNAKGAIMATLIPSGLIDIFDQFQDTHDWSNLTVQERIHSLSVFSGFAMGGNGLSNEEYYACKITETTPKEQASDFLSQITFVSSLNSNSAYTGDKPNMSLLTVLVDRIDDVLLGGDNYNRFIRGLTKVSLSNKSFVDSHLPSTDQQWLDRQIYWHDNYNYLHAPIGTHRYQVVLKEDGNVEVQRQIVSKHQLLPGNANSIAPYRAVWDSGYAFNTLNPFDLVLITNRSSLAMIQVAGATPNQPYLAPAIILKYCKDKEFNTQTITTVAVVLSAVAVVTGPAAIIGAVHAGNTALALFEGIQFVGAYADLVANSNSSQEVKDCVNSFNVIVGVWGITRIAVSSARYTVDYLSGVKAGVMNPIPVSVAETYRTRYNAVKNNLEDISAEGQEQLRRMDDLMAREVVAVANIMEVARGTSKAEFINSVGDFSGGANAQLADQAWTLWKNEDWASLEQLFITNQLNKYNNIIYPPNNGAINIERIALNPIEFGNNLVIDRYGPPTGKFASPINTPFPQRALPYPNNNLIANKYKVLKSIPNVERSLIIPWFGQPGLGIQYKFEFSIQYYIDNEFLEVIH